MNSTQDEIMRLMNSSSIRGKLRISPVDLGRRLDLSQRKLRSELRTLIEEQKLAYWTSGSGSYIMLKSHYDSQKEIEEITQ